MYNLGSIKLIELPDTKKKKKILSIFLVRVITCKLQKQNNVIAIT